MEEVMLTSVSGVRKFVLVLLGLLPFSVVLAGSFHNVAKEGDLAQVRMLLNNGVPVDTRDEFGNTALHFASLNGHADLVANLLEAGASINATNHYGATPLMLAEYHDHYDLAKWLVQRGADPNVRASDGSTVLSEAWKKKRWEFVQFLFLHGVNLNAPIDYSAGKGPPLVAAVWEGVGEMVEWFLQQNVDINAKNSLGYSALHEAARAGRLEIVKLLFKHGADVNSKSMGDTTPLHTAVVGQNLNMVRFLIENGADVNAQAAPGEYDKEWQTPLTLAEYLAKKQRRVDDPIVALLIQHGAKLPDKMQAGAQARPSVCHSETYVLKLNNLNYWDRLARFSGSDARLFVEAVFFWEYGEPEPIDPSLYDTAVVWSLERVMGHPLAPLALFKDGCAVNMDTGFISPNRVSSYKEIVRLATDNADPGKLRAALLDLAEQLKAHQEGVFMTSLEVGPAELVSEFEARIKKMLKE